MFIEFIPLCSAYNSDTRQGARKQDLACTYLTCMRASATRLVHTRVLCTRDSTSSILASAHMPAHMQNEKRIVSSTCHTRALSTLNLAVP